MTSEERRIVTVQLVVAGLMWVTAVVIRAMIDPLAETTSAFEALLEPKLWTGLMRFAASYILLAAAAGYAVGTAAAAGVMLVSDQTPERRRGVLLAGPIMVALLAVLFAIALP